METKTFDILKVKQGVKLQIGKEGFVLDEIEVARLLNVFQEVKTAKLFFPDKLVGCCVMYPNGLIAANVSISKTAPVEGREQHYILFVYSLPPKSSSYDVNTFVVTDAAVDKYIETLAS